MLLCAMRRARDGCATVSPASVGAAAAARGGAAGARRAEYAVRRDDGAGIDIDIERPFDVP